MLKEAATIGQTLKAGAFYFALVIAAGFVLGTIRTLWIVARVGATTAGLMETLIIFAVIVFSAHRLAEQLLLPPNVATRLGFVALGLMLIKEITVVLWLRGLTIRKYLASRDPVAGTAYHYARAPCSHAATNGAKMKFAATFR